ncbi:MAG: hypothetical protein GC160_17870 [Acidobacteria bacterium]|nr:hypothetical protein [Acidobacteriota bacterium]
MPFKKSDVFADRPESELQFLPFVPEGSMLGDPATQGALVFLLPLAERQPIGLEHLVVDLLGDGPKRHYVAERGVYRGPESLGIGWRFGGKTVPTQPVPGVPPASLGPALELSPDADEPAGLDRPH